MFCVYDFMCMNLYIMKIMKEFLMNKKKLIFVAGVAVLQTMLIVACAKSGGGGGSPAPAPTPAVATVVTVGTGPLALPAGSQYRFYAQNQMWANYYRTYGYSLATSASFTPNSNFKLILKEAMGVCDQNSSTGGVYDCTNWQNSGYHDIGVEFSGATPNTAKVIIRSYPNQTSGYSASWSLPSVGDALSSFFGFGTYTETQATYNPMVVQMAGDPINDSQGFQLTSYGPNWSKAWNNKITIVVESGKIEDSSLSFKLKYKKDGSSSLTLVGEGTLNRCQTQTCGF